MKSRVEEMLHQIAIRFFKPLGPEHIRFKESSDKVSRTLLFTLNPEVYGKRLEALLFRIDPDGQVHLEKMIQGKSNLTHQAIQTQLDRINRLTRGERTYASS